ncbi:MAG: hypothetical protein ACI93R_002032 [Flavobacteriales bacterium]|jgi:hypothetical protein
MFYFCDAIVKLLMVIFSRLVTTGDAKYLLHRVYRSLYLVKLSSILASSLSRKDGLSAY